MLFLKVFFLLLLLVAPVRAGTGEAFSFVVFGDNRDGDEVFVDLIKKVNAEKVDFAVNTGDFVSRGQASEYAKYFGLIKQLDCKIYHVPGNHDLVRRGYKNWEKYFGPYYYSFDYGNSHFIVLNNAFQKSFSRRQYEWLLDELRANQRKNLFVFMHKPLFDPTELFKDQVMSGVKVTRQLMSDFSKYKVDYVFAGHLHGYAREERDGVVYIVAAGAGAPLYLPKDFGGFYNYVKIRVDGNKIADLVVKIYE